MTEKRRSSRREYIPREPDEEMELPLRRQRDASWQAGEEQGEPPGARRRRAAWAEGDEEEMEPPALRRRNPAQLKADEDEELGTVPRSRSASRWVEEDEEEVLPSKRNSSRLGECEEEEQVLPGRRNSSRLAEEEEQQSLRRRRGTSRWVEDEEEEVSPQGRSSSRLVDEELEPRSYGRGSSARLRAVGAQGGSRSGGIGRVPLAASRPASRWQSSTIDHPVRNGQMLLKVALCVLVAIIALGAWLFLSNPGGTVVWVPQTLPASLVQVPALKAAGIELTALDQQPGLSQEQALALAEQLEPDAAVKAQHVEVWAVKLNYAGSGTARAGLKDVPAWLIWYQKIPVQAADTAVDPKQPAMAQSDLYVFLDAQSGKELLAISL